MSNSSSEIAYLNYLSRATVGYGGLILLILGTIGNSINMVIFSYLPQFNKGPSSIFLRFSFFGSQVNLLTILLAQIVAQLSGVDPLVTYLILCKLRWFIGSSSATIGLYCLCLAAINQYLLTSHNFRHHRWINRKRALLMSICAVIFCMGIVVPNLVFYKHITNSLNKTQCGVTDPFGGKYDTYSGLVAYSIIPIVVLSLFSLLTWRNVRKKLVRTTMIEQTLTRLIFAQIIMVLIAAMAFASRRSYALYQMNVVRNALEIAQDTLLNSAFLLVGFIIHSSSFYTYLCSSRIFRENLLFLLCKKPISNQIVPPQQI
ncbi:unnamed protein product [Adineta ricciae]|uniref:G-protein coupled receptors family 1 profile domain-containing protein n=1 Tax=Adineta ricciae TaxID=249248 RepID=A0A815KGT1_ADIRI|nr:unnamed protein product [Adineta ricciae]CAF1640591.1 unnamed protein product [Adineta ricciae]